jgi:hypothetical protein
LAGTLCVESDELLRSPSCARVGFRERWLPSGRQVVGGTATLEGAEADTDAVRHQAARRFFTDGVVPLAGDMPMFTSSPITTQSPT